MLNVLHHGIVIQKIGNTATHIIDIGHILFRQGDLACQNDSVSNNPPKVTNGILDLKNWDLKKNGPIDLTGKWEFYWNRHLTPEDFSKPTPPEKTIFLGCQVVGIGN